MSLIRVCVLAVAAGGVIAAPRPEARALVAGLGDPDVKVPGRVPLRALAQPRGTPCRGCVARPIAADRDTAKRAAELLAPHDKKRQETVAKAIDACVREGHIDLLTEWHQYWRPRQQEDLWPVGLARRQGRAGPALPDVPQGQCGITSSRGWSWPRV